MMVPSNRLLRALVVCLPALVGCDPKHSAGSAERSEAVVLATSSASLLDSSALSSAVQQLKSQAGPGVRALKLEVFPNRLVLQAEAREHPGIVHQFEYRSGRVSGPVRVALKGPGRLEDNLFTLEEAQLDAIPALARSAVHKVDPHHGTVRSIVLRRNLPHGSELRFRVFVASPVLDGQVDADATGSLVDS
jgi:hypothetical protein